MTAERKSVSNKGSVPKRARRKTAPADKAAGVAMPSWRRIEALRERRALLDQLTDIWTESPQLGDDIFFPDDEELRRLYQPAARLRKEDFEIEDADIDLDDDDD